MRGIRKRWGSGSGGHGYTQRCSHLAPVCSRVRPELHVHRWVPVLAVDAAESRGYREPIDDERADLMRMLVGG